MTRFFRDVYQLIRTVFNTIHSLLQIICSQTHEILQHPSFEEVELPTVMTILDQDFLHIDSELDLFLALVRYAEKHGHGKLICKKSYKFRSSISIQRNFVNLSKRLLCSQRGSGND